MKLLTANDLASGRVIYWGADGQPTSAILEAAQLEGADADAALAQAQSRPAVYVNPYLIEAVDHRPNGRHRLKESIRSAGPTVGHSLKHKPVAEVA